MTNREIVLLFETKESAEHPSLSAPVMLWNPEHLAFF
jgi:hypothetical protein